MQKWRFQYVYKSKQGKTIKGSLCSLKSSLNTHTKVHVGLWLPWCFDDWKQQQKKIPEQIIHYCGIQKKKKHTWWRGSHIREVANLERLMIWRSWIRTPVRSSLGCIKQTNKKSTASASVCLRAHAFEITSDLLDYVIVFADKHAVDLINFCLSFINKNNMIRRI